MRTLKLQMQVSVDGFVAGAQGEMDWLVWEWDEELNRYVAGITEPVDLIILGRVLAEGFIPTWEARLADPQTADDGARIFVETPKVVFTHTLKESQWARTTLATGDLAQEISALKNQPGGDIIAYGGARFASSLIREGVVDEFHLFVNPVILGKGLAIFSDLGARQELQLVESRPFACGIVLLRYEPRRQAPA